MLGNSDSDSDHDAVERDTSIKNPNVQTLETNSNLATTIIGDQTARQKPTLLESIFSFKLFARQVVKGPIELDAAKNPYNKEDAYL